MYAVIILALLVLVEWYSYVFVKTLIRNKRTVAIYLLINFAFLVYLAYFFTSFDRHRGQTHYTMYLMGVLMFVFFPKVVVTLIFIIQDFFRSVKALWKKLNRPKQKIELPGRRKFVTQAALGLAAIPFFSILYGMVKGKYNFHVIKQPVYFDDLPDAFDGFKILQISDLHCGSFDDREKIAYGIDLINAQDYDLFVFTGDLVNSLAEEVDPWISALRNIKTPQYGKYSILGNHDYGEYMHFDTEAEKEANFVGIKNRHKKIDFELLLNQNVKLQKDGEEIALVGVENWGLSFKRVGDLKKASEGLTDKDFKVLLTHDPSHWDAEVNTHPNNYHLTLAGHTRGMQFGIEIPNVVKWSPIKYLYKQWAGLYEKSQRFIYVNRGFGFHAYAGRVGIMPEITVLELKKRRKNV